MVCKNVKELSVEKTIDLWYSNKIDYKDYIKKITLHLNKKLLNTKEYYILGDVLKKSGCLQYKAVTSP